MARYSFGDVEVQMGEFRTADGRLVQISGKQVSPLHATALIGVRPDLSDADLRKLELAIEKAWQDYVSHADTVVLSIMASHAYSVVQAFRLAPEFIDRKGIKHFAMTLSYLGQDRHYLTRFDGSWPLPLVSHVNIYRVGEILPVSEATARWRQLEQRVIVAPGGRGGALSDTFSDESTNIREEQWERMSAVLGQRDKPLALPAPEASPALPKPQSAKPATAPALPARALQPPAQQRGAPPLHGMPRRLDE
jgi:hypothetical protein